MADERKKINTKRPFKDYELYVFDLDGTLYFQKELRLIMAGRLLGYYICHPFSVKELLIVKKFREVRDGWSDLSGDVDKKQYMAVAKAFNTDAVAVEKVIRRWIYVNPLDAVAKSKDKKLIEVIEKLHELGKRVVIFSDYPTEDKLKALGVRADGQYCSSDNAIGALKPSGRGLKVIMNDFSTDNKDVIMVGDRLEKDGMSAADAGCDYLILERGRKKRSMQYDLMALK